jgi:polyisoprenoid-binding protein YceI
MSQGRQCSRLIHSSRRRRTQPIFRLPDKTFPELDSGAPQRDDHVRNDTLQVSKYPVATFVAGNAPILTGNYTDGQSVSFQLPGSLTLHGVTRTVTFDMQGTLTAGTISGFGTTVIHIADYQMQPPQITSVVTVTIQKDIGLRLDFVAHANQCAS